MKFVLNIWGGNVKHVKAGCNNYKGYKLNEKLNSGGINPVDGQASPLIS